MRWGRTTPPLLAETDSSLTLRANGRDRKGGEVAARGSEREAKKEEAQRTDEKSALALASCPEAGGRPSRRETSHSLPRGTTSLIDTVRTKARRNTEGMSPWWSAQRRWGEEGRIGGQTPPDGKVIQARMLLPRKGSLELRMRQVEREN